MSLQSTDPIADLLTRIRNAKLVGKREVTVPTSKIKETIARKLVDAKYLTDVRIEEAKPRNLLVITINNEGENATISEIERVSKPGRRVYVASGEIPRVKNGRGIVLVSTSQGVITGQQARQAKLGGELLLKVY
jgi:small subunit ribosomal protein S8